ncbi:hypothetical protein GCM10020001_016370 [Nonomuraea salmonea]
MREEERAQIAAGKASVKRSEPVVSRARIPSRRHWHLLQEVEDPLGKARKRRRGRLRGDSTPQPCRRGTTSSAVFNDASPDPVPGIPQLFFVIWLTPVRDLSFDMFPIYR